MRKEANIYIHQIKTAVHPGKELMDIWKELESYEIPQQDQLLDELDIIRQQEMAAGNESLGNMLEQLITNVRIGVKSPQPKNVPKRF